jgi:Polyketide cyclase / dehydrase and lipid transport
VGDKVVSVERVIEAPASAIFAIVADASRHAEIDGSGAVKHLKEGQPQNLSLGSTFGMSMKLGVPYSMSNKVIEYEPDKRIAWQTTLSGPLGRFIGGRIWRYELEDAGAGTLVRETWDITQDKQRFMLAAGPVGKQTAQAMTKTLGRLAELTESPSA